jgi:hypothetical protein
VGGGTGGKKIKANSAQLNLVGAWAELGKITSYTPFFNFPNFYFTI